LALALLLVSVSGTVGRSAVVDEFYGSGVHQYFAGNYSQALSDLTAAIRAGTRDPRAYYFRALAQMRVGGNVEADLRKGAALEIADVNQAYPVGKSLERVQGSVRIALERHRAVARATAYQRQHDRDALRYDQLRRAEPEVVRSSGTRPILPPPDAPKPAVPEVTDDDPFADKDEKTPAVKAPAKDAPAEEKPAEDAEEMKPDDEALPSDEPTETPVPPAPEPPVPDSESPAAGETAPKSDDENPFADDPPAAKPE
jgi:hypothetical protein